MNEQEYAYWVNSMEFLVTNIRNNLPYVTGNLKRNTKALISISGEKLGEIILDVPYANYVNTGFEKHPQSEKLERDYHIVEKTTMNTLKAIYQSKGAIVEYE